MSEQKNYRLRIINKSKDGVTLKAASGTPQKMSWNEFNKNFVMEDDKMHCHFTEEFIKLGEQIEEHKMNAAVAFIMSEATSADSQEKLTQMLIMGHEIEEIQKLVHCTHLEACMLVKQLVNEIRSGSIFGKGRKETPQEYRERKKQEAAERKRRQEEMNPHHTYTPTATTTMADVPGMDKLKDMFAGQ